MTRIEPLSGRGCPKLYCDICGRRIDDAGLAMAAWDFDARIVHHVHKGRCLDKFEQAGDPEALLCTEELSTHLLQLAANYCAELRPLVHCDGWITELRAKRV